MSHREGRWSFPRVPRSAYHAAGVILLAAALCLPVILRGLPPGYDAEYHAAYQYHFSRQFWDGDLYPRWLTGANKGYGSPIFLIQYPLPYSAAALLRPLTRFPANDVREARELGILCFLALVAAGVAARIWLRASCTPLGASAGAAFYISAPYVLGQSLYLRTGLGELCALVWIPLALARCDALRFTATSVAALATVLALLLLTHLTSAVIFLPVMFVYLAVTSNGQSNLTRRLAAGLLAVTLGIGLAGIYVVPFVAYRHLFDLDAMRTLIPSFELGRWFAYLTWEATARRFVLPASIVTSAFAATVLVYISRSSMNRLSRVGAIVTLLLGLVLMVPSLGSSLIRASGLTVSSFETAGDFSARLLFSGLLTSTLAFLSYAVAAARTRRQHFLLATVCFSFLMSLPWSAPLWNIEALANIQFPFRFGAILSIASAGLVGAAFGRSHLRPPFTVLAAVGSAALLTVAVGAALWRVPTRFLSPSTTNLAIAHNVDNMFRSYIQPQQVDAFGRKILADVDSFDVGLTEIDEHVRGEAVASTLAGGPCEVMVNPVRARVIHVSAECEAAARLEIEQVYSPLWRARSPGSGASPAVVASPENGLMEVTLESGHSEFDLVFDGGPPERAGIVATLVSAGLIAAAAALTLLRGALPRSGTLANTGP